jgi:uncharacterized membrane protein (UPF0127 family)
VTRARAAAVAVLAVVLLAVVGVVIVVATGGSDSDNATGPRATGNARSPFLVSPAPAVRPFLGLTEARLAVGGACKRVVIADSLAERVEGLTGRRDLGPYDGMLFVFEGPSTAAFTMSGVPVPLDIGFYDADGSQVSRRRMKPCPGSRADCPTYSAGAAFSYALETLGGKLPAGALSSCS